MFYSNVERLIFKLTNMRTRVFLATCLFAFLFSCSTKKEQEEVVIQSLKHEVLMGDEYLIGKINDMALMNDSIPVVINVSSDKMFQVLDHSRKKVLEVGNVGQGPDDFLLSFGLSSEGKNTFTANDVNRRRFSTVHLNPEDDSWRVEHHLKFDSIMHIYIKPIANNWYVATGIYDDCHLMLLDEKGTPLKGFGEWPYQDEQEKKVPGKIRASVYQGKLEVSPSKDKLVFAVTSGDMLYFYRVLPDGDLELVSKKENAYAHYDHSSGAHYGTAPEHHIDACTTEDYVYTLYSGRSLKEYGLKCFQGNLIHVYDWEGKLVKKLQLDIDIKQMAVTKDNRKIYAIADLPDPVLVVFEL